MYAMSKKTLIFVGSSKITEGFPRDYSCQFNVDFTQSAEDILDRYPSGAHGIIIDPATPSFVQHVKDLPAVIQSLKKAFEKTAIIILANELPENLQIELYAAGSDHIMPMIAPLGSARPSLLEERINNITRRYFSPNNNHKSSELPLRADEEDDNSTYLDAGKNALIFIDKSGKKVCRFPPQEYELLKALVQNPERIHERSRLIELAWPPNHTPDSDRSVDTAVRKIRERLKKHGIPNIITTTYRKGYAYIPPKVDPS